MNKYKRRTDEYNTLFEEFEKTSIPTFLYKLLSELDGESKNGWVLHDEVVDIGYCSYHDFYAPFTLLTKVNKDDFYDGNIDFYSGTEKYENNIALEKEGNHFYITTYKSKRDKEDYRDRVKEHVTKKYPVEKLLNFSIAIKLNYDDDTLVKKSLIDSSYFDVFVKRKDFTSDDIIIDAIAGLKHHLKIHEQFEVCYRLEYLDDNDEKVNLFFTNTCETKVKNLDKILRCLNDEFGKYLLVDSILDCDHWKEEFLYRTMIKLSMNYEETKKYFIDYWKVSKRD